MLLQNKTIIYKIQNLADKFIAMINYDNSEITNAPFETLNKFN